MAGDATLIDREVEEFLGALAAERGLAPNTLAGYRRDLADYVAFLATRDIRASAAVRAEDVQAFLGSLWSRGLARSTVARRLAAVRGLHRFQVAEGVVEVDPTAGIEGPNKPSGLPKALTVDEVERLIGGADVTTPLGRRDAALIEVLYASGARVAEAVALDLTDIDLEERTAIVTGKGAKQRLVLLGGHAVAAVEAYLPSRMDIKGDRPDDGALFLNARGSRLTRQGAWRVVRRCAERAGLGTDRVSPHVLRHSAATHMVEGGADLRTVQEMLGHASISTTQIYTRVSPQHLLEVFVTSHPRSR